MTVRSIPQTPLSVGRYELIGRGNVGISAVHRARDAKDELVAVYLFPDEPDSARLLARLNAAVEAAAALDHPNILRVIDGGRESGHGYLITEWVAGTTLARQVETHARLPEVTVIRFLAQVGQAMDHVRKEDRVPCRVGLSNVLVRPDGVVKVIPFRFPDEGDTVPVPGLAVLKPEFAAALSAERAGGTPVPFAELMFSLGTTLHEALTGTPWVPSEPPVPGARRRRPPPRLVGLSERTERTIRRATDPDPRKRPATCAEFLKLLRGRPLTAGAPKTDARPAGSGIENRGFVRYSLGVGANCTINMSLFDSADKPSSQIVWPLVVQDVSASGIGILLARRCEPGTELALEVPAGAERAIRSLPVRVVRLRKDNFGHWMHGCEFLTPLDEPALAALLAQIGKSESA